VALSALRTADCVYLRPPGPTVLTAEARLVPASPAELQGFGAAERASCDLSHSHEVSDAFTVGEPAASYPGLPSLVETFGPRCDAAFAAFVGHPLAGSAYETALAVPDPDGWSAGARYGVCFVFNADRSLLDRRARGSGR
jgi:putative regulator of septum formation